MIRARAALVGRLRGFFDAELRGVFRWDEVRIFPAINVEKVKGQRPVAFGKHEEVVSIGFGRYTMAVASPYKHPPLGHVLLTLDAEVLAEGTLDSKVWAQAGEAIRSREVPQMGVVNG